MPHLTAQGLGRNHRWRKRIPTDQTLTLGRGSGEWSVPWDDHISREHLTFRWKDGVLLVHSLARSSNPIFFQGVEVESFRMVAGEHFVIGSTTFSLHEEAASLELTMAPPATEQTFSLGELRQLSFRNPGQRLDLLSRLPEQLATAQDETLYERIVQVTMEGISMASAVLLCKGAKEIDVLSHDQRAAGTLHASQSLIALALEHQESVVHTWDTTTATTFTGSDGVDWAFCIPFTNPVCTGWALYVSGQVNRSSKRAVAVALEDLQEEMKFAEVVVSTVSSFCEVRDLQRRQSSLTQFFSPAVAATLADGNAEQALAPREVEVTVLFCDLRGFSLETERSADDLLGLLERVSDALGVLTREILREGGVIGDFHGDAAMGFWGWPMAQPDAAERAAHAAIAFRREFESVSQHSKHPLANFRIGVGIASGPAVAGKIGTADQVKITAFGPAVNLASRLEGMTKLLNTPILIDEKTAATLATSTDMRLRRLARIQPYGMNSAIEVHELLPSAADYPLLRTEHIAAYEAALDAFQAGDWHTAWEKLHKVPAGDTSKDLLTTYIASRNRIVPSPWDGVIRMQSK